MKKQTTIGIISAFIGLLWLVGCAHRLQVIESEPLQVCADYSQVPRKIWERKVSTPVREAFALNDRQLLVATYRGELFLLDTQTGKRISRYWTPFRRPVQILYLDTLKQLLYVSGVNETKVFGYDLGKGSVMDNWRLPGLDGTMVVRGEDLYVIQHEKWLRRLDARNLKILASVKLPVRGVAGLFQSGKDLLMLVGEDGKLRSFGQDLHSQTVIDLHLNPAPVVYFQNDTLLAADSRGRVVGVHNETVLCSFDFGKAIFSRPVVAGELAFIAFADGEVVGLNLRTGEIIWRRQDAGLINLPLQWRQGMLFVPLANGRIVVLEARQGSCRYELDARYPLKTLVITNNRIIAIRRDKIVIGWQW